jgi:drug/metabolite transporter (DMT)-like permease
MQGSPIVTAGQLSSVQTVRAILWAIAGMVVFSLQDVIIKWMSGDYPLHEVVFLRTCFGLGLTLIIAHFEGGLKILKTRRLSLHLLRGLFIVICNATYFTALATMALAEAMAIFFVAPLFITALSVPFLGEHVGWRRWLAVAGGLCGVLLIVQPSSSAFQWIAVLPLFSALGYAATQLLTRRLGATDAASTMSFYIQLTLLGFSLLMGLSIGDGKLSGSGNPNLEFLVRAWIWPELQDMGFFALSGCMVAVGGFAVSQAYRTAAATTVAPFEYLALPFAMLWGFLIWGDFPNTLAFAGIALIILAGLVVILRERQKGQVLSSARPLTSRHR